MDLVKYRGKKKARTSVYVITEWNSTGLENSS